MPHVVHHTAVYAADIDASLRFYRDGLGMEVTTQGEYDGPFRRLFSGPSDRLAMTMLGDPGRPGAGTVELIQYLGGDVAPADPAARNGLALISFYCDVEGVLASLGQAGFPDHERSGLTTPDGKCLMASIRDPDGVVVELVDSAMGARITG